MKETYKTNIPSADEIADMADSGEDISRFFTNKGKMKYPAQRISMDFPADMLKELDDIATELNLSRQAVIVAYLRHALDQHYMAQKYRRS
ncbi:hypothetical protein [Desulfonema magnum]|uniref:CopG family transcriptional regulator n=1 Tax=Desulfonema magnum TaxID=45655 RepID=A0A975BXG1_9BACT|nr:hypothetical protein [Desulfonema magnum]QTA92965.1 Uncharacterized protein dnm_090580 [Desulfonema magnum]